MKYVFLARRHNGQICQEDIGEALQKERVFLSGFSLLSCQAPAIHAVSPTVGPTAPEVRSSLPAPSPGFLSRAPLMSCLLVNSFL